MRLIVQGFRRGGNKKTLEQLELIIIALLIIVSIITHALSKEKKDSTVSMQQIFKANMEESFLDLWFPVLSSSEKTFHTNPEDMFFSKIVSYSMPLYAYTENNAKREMIPEGREEDNPVIYERESYVIEDVSEEMIQLLESENGFSKTAGTEFVKNTEKVTNLNLNDYETTEDFVQAFYTVDSVTEAIPALFDVEVLKGMDMTIKQGNDKPQILIYHTHSQEAFADSVLGDLDTTIVGAGELLKDILTNEYGYNVIHHTGEYDVPSRDYAYSKSLPALEQILEENPSIEVVIDLHRDGVAETTHFVTDIGGAKTAKIMFFNGLSRTKKNGAISYLKNDHLQENLAFSFQLQMAAKEYYPGLTRKNYLNGYRYNMHLRGKSLLIELGAQTNTVAEIRNAIAPLAHILDIVLSGE